MIKHLVDNHQQFINKLNTKLLCITRQFAYVVENDEMLTKLIEKQVCGVLKELLLGVHAQYLIVRCLNFLDETTTNQAFNSLIIRGQLVLVKLNSGVYKVEIRKLTGSPKRIHSSC